MELYVKIFIGIMIPLIGTSLGAALVFFFKKNINPIIEKIFLGFASGVMIAASVWSLLIPAIEMSEQQGNIGWIAPSIGFLLGMFFLMFVDNLIDSILKGFNKQVPIMWVNIIDLFSNEEYSFKNALKKAFYPKQLRNNVMDDLMIRVIFLIGVL